MPAEQLTHQERSQLGSLTPGLDCGRVRVYRRGLLRRIVLGATRDRAIALGNHVFLPDRCRDDRAVLAHELTHCGQYQAWGPLTYFARGARAQLRDLVYRTTGIGASPYCYRLEAGKPFAAYGMEQQAQMIEDCCRGLLDPRLLHRPDPPLGDAPGDDAPRAPDSYPPIAPARFRRDQRSSP